MISLYDLKALAAAVEQRESVSHSPGIGCPPKIRFYRHDGNEATNLADNPELLEAVKREIRLSWDELRDRALQRLDDSVAQLSAKVLPDIQAEAEPSLPSPVTGGRT